MMQDDKSDDTLRNERQALKELQETAGWKLMQSALNERAQMYWREVMFQPARAQEEVMAQEHQKGKFVALMEVLQLPENWIMNIEAQLTKGQEDGGSDDDQ